MKVLESFEDHLNKASSGSLKSNKMAWITDAEAQEEAGSSGEVPGRLRKLIKFLHVSHAKDFKPLIIQFKKPSLERRDNAGGQGG